MQTYKIDDVSFSTKGIKGLVKSPSVWGRINKKNVQYPLIYFRKPGWINQENFEYILSKLTMMLPPDLEIKQ